MTNSKNVKRKSIAEIDEKTPDVGVASLRLVTSEKGKTREKMSIGKRFWDAGRQVTQANLITFRALWDAQPKATVARLLVGLGAVMGPLLSWWGSGTMVDALTRTHSVEDLFLGASAFVVSLAMMGVIPVALSSLERMSDNWTFEMVFGKLTRKMITFSQEHLSDPVLAEQAKQVRERAVWRMMSMARSQPQMIRNTGMFLVSGFIVGTNEPLLLAVLAAFSVPSMVLELRHARRRADLEERLAPTWGALWGDLYNLMVAPALAMLHQFGAALWFAGRYRRGLAAASKEECLLENDAARHRVLAALLVGVGLTLGVTILAQHTRSGALKTGEFVLVLGAISSLAGCLSEFASLLGQQWSQSKSIKDLTDFLRHPFTEEISPRLLPYAREYDGEESTEDMRVEERSGSEHLTFEDVWYRYPSAARTQHAVRGISFSVPRGAVVAVVGPNGAGKSSTMALMLRQLQPTEGRVLIDGKPIDQMTAEEFASRVVMLPQQLRHYNLTVRELLNLGRPRNPASDEALWGELTRIGAADFVRKWKSGLDTPLGLDRREAIEPSGGQLQRLLLAAVVIANRGLIVMDEPVSAVDPEAAKRFWDALFAETTDRTVIFSTHHLGAVRRADMILFIEDGRIAAQGTHDELMERSEHYQRLFEAQATEYR